MITMWQLIALFTVLAVFCSADYCFISIRDFGKVCDCSGKGLRQVPSSEIPVDVSYLILDNNAIETLPASAFTNFSQLRKLSLRANSIRKLERDLLKHLPALEYLDLLYNQPLLVNDHTIPPHSFDSNHQLRVLILTAGHNDQLPSAFSSLQRLEHLQLKLDASGEQPLSDVVAKLPSLKVLNLSHGRIDTLNISFLEPLRHSKVEELMFVNSKIRFIEPNLVKDFPSLHTVNLACNEIDGGFVSAMKAFAELGSTPLDSLILDGLLVGYPAYITAEDLCTDITRVRRLSLKSNRIIGGHVNAIPCVQMEVLSVGYYNTPYFITPTTMLDYAKQAILNVPIKSLDVSYLYSNEPGFRSKYCNEFNVLTNNDYFPPPLDSLPIVPESNVTILKQTDSSDIRPFLPAGLKNIDANHFGLHLNGMEPSFLSADYNNSLTVMNLSSNQFFSQFPKIGNLWKMQIVDLSYNALKSIPLESQAALHDMVNLRHLNLSNNLLYSGEDDYTNTFHSLVELVTIRLSHNSLVFLGNSSFANSTKLEEVHVDHNNLVSRINLQVSQNPNLRILDLSHNALQHLTVPFMDELDSLGASLQVDLSNNPLVCDCDAISFIKWLKATEVTITDKERLECSFHNQPVQMIGFYIASLQEVCEKPDSNRLMKILIFGILTLAIAAFLGLGYRFKWHK